MSYIPQAIFRCSTDRIRITIIRLAQDQGGGDAQSAPQSPGCERLKPTRWRLLSVSLADKDQCLRWMLRNELHRMEGAASTGHMLALCWPRRPYCVALEGASARPHADRGTAPPTRCTLSLPSPTKLNSKTNCDQGQLIRHCGLMPTVGEG